MHGSSYGVRRNETSFDWMHCSEDFSAVVLLKIDLCSIRNHELNIHYPFSINL